MLEKAQAHALAGRLHFEQGDLSAWHPDGLLDLLVSNAALPWPPLAGKRLHGAARPRALSGRADVADDGHPGRDHAQPGGRVEPPPLAIKYQPVDWPFATEPMPPEKRD